jgi:hypothetical protein
LPSKTAKINWTKLQCAGAKYCIAQGANYCNAQGAKCCNAQGAKCCNAQGAKYCIAQSRTDVMRKARTAVLREARTAVMRTARTAVTRKREMLQCAGANYFRITSGRLPPSFDSSSAGCRQLPETGIKNLKEQ